MVTLKVLRSNICIIHPFSLQPLTKYLLVALPESSWLSIDTRKCRVEEFWDPWSIGQAHGSGRAEACSPQSAFPGVCRGKTLLPTECLMETM